VLQLGDRLILITFTSSGFRPWPFERCRARNNNPPGRRYFLTTLGAVGYLSGRLLLFQCVLIDVEPCFFLMWTSRTAVGRICRL
jgi:hypothetical protein